MALGHRIKALREERGWSQSELARRAGISQTTIAGLESRDSRSSSHAAAIARALGTDAMALLSREPPRKVEPPPMGTGETEPESTYHYEVTPAPAAPAPNWANWPMDVPVYGVARGGDHDEFDDLFQLETQVVDHVRRPPGVRGPGLVFAFFVHGDSMAPRYETSALIYAHRHQPPMINGDVLVEVRARDSDRTVGALIKRLVRRTADKVVLLQYNPEKLIEIDARRVKKLYHVLSAKELMGV